MLLILSPVHYGSCSLMNQKNLFRVHHRNPTNWKLYLLEHSLCRGLRRKVDHHLLCVWSSSIGSILKKKKKKKKSSSIGGILFDEPEESSSCSSSEADEFEALPSGTFYVWRPKTESGSSPFMRVE
ncbi:unnamed protein product [Lactuca saligna]|uniref:Uncharacterized protein n=1 Tax=Lactuca saligna TaxID=75948 RepID=A0AA35V6N6_LACSI|nr:unnamed protein product [Lactuca saligna]